MKVKLEPPDIELIDTIVSKHCPSKRDPIVHVVPKDIMKIMIIDLIERGKIAANTQNVEHLAKDWKNILLTTYRQLN